MQILELLPVSLLYLLVLISALVTALSPIYGALFIGALFLCGLIFARPDIGFQLVVGMTFLFNVNLLYDSPIRILHERYPALFPFFFFMGLAWFAHLAINKHRPAFQVQVEHIITLFFLLWSGAATLWTPDVFHGLGMMFSLTLGIMVYFFCATFLQTMEDISRLYRFFFWWSIILGLQLTLSNKVADGIQEGVELVLSDDWTFNANLVVYTLRAGGFAPPQIAGSITIFMMLAGLSIYHQFGKTKRILFALMWIWFTSNIFATGSKGAAGSFMIAMMLMIVAYPRLQLLEKLRYMFLFLTLSIGVFVFNVLVLKADRLASGIELATLTFTNRLGFWDTGLSELALYPAGLGTGGFARLVDPWPGAHNIYFSVLFDLGPIGFLIFLVLLGILLHKLLFIVYNASDRTRVHYIMCYLTVLIAFLIHGTVDHSFDSTYFWALIGIGFALANMKSDLEPANASRQQRY